MKTNDLTILHDRKDYTFMRTTLLGGCCLTIKINQGVHNGRSASEIESIKGMRGMIRLEILYLSFIDVSLCGISSSELGPYADYIFHERRDQLMKFF